MSSAWEELKDFLNIKEMKNDRCKRDDFASAFEIFVFHAKFY